MLPLSDPTRAVFLPPRPCQRARLDSSGRTGQPSRRRSVASAAEASPSVPERRRASPKRRRASPERRRASPSVAERRRASPKRRRASGRRLFVKPASAQARCRTWASLCRSLIDQAMRARWRGERSPPRRQRARVGQAIGPRRCGRSARPGSCRGCAPGPTWRRPSSSWRRPRGPPLPACRPWPRPPWPAPLGALAAGLAPVAAPPRH